MKVVRFHFINSLHRFGTINSKKKLGIALILCGIILMAATILVIFRLRPLLSQVAVSNTGDAVTKMINDSVTEIMSREHIGYDDLVSLKKDSSGDVTALVTNISKINSLQAEISNRVLEKLYENEAQLIEIPLGNVIGGVLFSGRGPDIPVKVVSLSSVYTKFRDNFDAAGINQTRHQIMLDIDVELDILLPGITETVAVYDEIVIAETIVVGEVPSAYASTQSEMVE